MSTVICFYSGGEVTILEPQHWSAEQLSLSKSLQKPVPTNRQNQVTIEAKQRRVNRRLQSADLLNLLG